MCAYERGARGTLGIENEAVTFYHLLTYASGIREHIYSVWHEVINITVHLSIRTHHVGLIDKAVDDLGRPQWMRRRPHLALSARSTLKNTKTQLDLLFT